MAAFAVHAIIFEGIYFYSCIKNFIYFTASKPFKIGISQSIKIMSIGLSESSLLDLLYFTKVKTASDPS